MLKSEAGEIDSVLYCFGEGGVAMKCHRGAASLFIFCFIFSASFIGAAERVSTGAAQRAAEYHGESIFEQDLKVCDHELLYWAWGEPAVYVFTLMREGDVYPSDILRSPSLLHGAYVVAIGKESEGYEEMAQPVRYWTVYVGATTDMPSFIKAHAGLPEHVLAQPLMRNRPKDPYWIYGDLFHILVTSRTRMGSKEQKASEIHTGQVYDLRDLGHDKIDAIPGSAEEQEWMRFFDARADLKATDRGTTVELKVKESNLQGKGWGCAAAAFYNCLKYLEEKGKVRLYGKTASFLQEWISICYMAVFDGENYWTLTQNEIPGSVMVFKGLNYDSEVSLVERKNRPDYLFFRYAGEINSGYPCSLGCGTGVFKNHATTGIGYWTSGDQVKLIIHDGWESTTRPVWTKYSGYPENDLVYPTDLETFRPGGSAKYPKAKLEIAGPDIIYSSKTDPSWKWREELASSNNIKAWAYSYDAKLRNSAGTVYKRKKPKYDRWIPYPSAWTWTWPKTVAKPGTMETKYKVLDANGHLLALEKTVELRIGDAYSGPFSGTLKSYATVMPSLWVKDTINITASICLEGRGTTSDPYQGVFSFDGKDTQTSSFTDGPSYFHVFGDGEVSGSNGQIVASAPMEGTLIEGQSGDKDGAEYQGYQIKFEGTKASNGTLTGTMTFDIIFEGITCVPVVKAVVLTKDK